MRAKMKKKGGKKKAKKRNFFTWKYLILTILSFSIVLFYVWERVGVLKDGYKITKRTERKNKLNEEKRLLRSEAAYLKSPQRLERIARGELGLIVPTNGKSIRRIAINRQ